MSKKGAYIGIGITVSVIVLVLLFTNILELTQPTIDQSIESAKDATSKVEGKDVVSGAEKIYSKIINETSKIQIKNPFP